MCGDSGCGYSVWLVGGGYTFTSMKYPYSSFTCTFWNLDLLGFCKLFFILVFVIFLRFLKLIRKIRILE